MLWYALHRSKCVQTEVVQVTADRCKLENGEISRSVL